MRVRHILTAVLAAASLRATLLEQLTLDDMIRQSTGIVRATVTGSRSIANHGSIYTLYHLHVLEAPKPVTGQAGAATSAHELDVAVPGGALNGIRQVAVGAPELNVGGEYVLFLWTGKSGITQIIGLSQGLFATSRDSSGRLVLNRAAQDEPMIDRQGHSVPSSTVALSWTELCTRIARQLAQKPLAGRQLAKRELKN